MPESFSSREQSEIEFLGFVQIPIPILYDSRLSYTEKFFWCLLKRYSRNSGSCFPSISKLAAGMGVSEKHVYELKDKLANCGLIKIRKRSGTRNEYEIVPMHIAYAKDQRGLMLNDNAIRDLEQRGETWTIDAIMSMRESCESPIAEKPVEIGAVGLKRKLEIDKEREAYEQNRKEKKGKQLFSSASPKGVKRVTGGEIPHGESLAHPYGGIEDAWIDSIRETWPEAPALARKFNTTDWRIVKSFVKENGGVEGGGVEFVQGAISVIVKNWKSYSIRFNTRAEYPDMKSLARYANIWFTEIRGGRRPDARQQTARDRAIESGEYKEGGTCHTFAFQEHLKKTAQ